MHVNTTIIVFKQKVEIEEDEGMHQAKTEFHLEVVEMNEEYEVVVENERMVDMFQLLM